MTLFTDVTTIDVSGNKRLASLPYEILEIMNTSTKINATGSPAYSSIDWSHVPHFQLSQGSELSLICRQINCERIRLRRNGLHDLSAVLSWMDAGAASWKYVDLSGNHFKSLCGKTCDVALQECGRVRENTQQCASSISNVQRWGDLRRIDLRFNNISGLCNNGAAILHNLLLGKGGRDMVPLNGNPLHVVTLNHVDSEVSMAAVNISTIEEYTCESCDGNKRTTEKILSMRQLKVLNISHMGGVECKLREVISMLSNLQRLDLSNTEISGTIPREISMLSNLQQLYLYDTHISGTIPREISMLSSLQGLALYETQISGTIPREISMLSNLQQLVLHETQISGTIPREISMLSSSQGLYLYNTKISGTIPREISMLSNLRNWICRHADQWHNSSRDIDAAVCKIVFADADWQFREISMLRFAGLDLSTRRSWHNSSRDIDAEQFAGIEVCTKRRSVAQFLERYRC